jgi:hypothetical protein
MQTSYFSRAEEDSIFSAAGGGRGVGSGLSHLSHSHSQASRQQGSGVNLEASTSMFSDTRLRSSQTASELSSVNYIRKFNADPRTVSNSRKKNPMLWPVQY